MNVKRSSGLRLPTSILFLVPAHRGRSMMPDLGAALRDAALPVATLLTTLS